MSSRCGTLAGYSTHRRLGEETCELCKTAKRDYQRAKLQQAGQCDVSGCNKRQVAKGACSAHYQRTRRNGDPTTSARDPERNFWARVQLGDFPEYAPHLGSCWEWKGKTNKAGYGVFTTEQVYVHRYAYEYMKAPIPEGLTIDHLCRVRNCVNPDHLEPVPRAENTRRELEARKELENV